MDNPIKILGVDDRPANLLALEAVLEPLDICFVKAHSGQKALELVLQQDFALILLDVQMPDIDGFEAAAHIRSNKKTENIPIIFVTAISFERKHVFKGYESGAVDYLFKPIDPKVLVSKVKVFIELYREKAKAKNRNQELQKANIYILEQQQVLQENETRFRTAFDQSFQFMAILDSHGRIIEINDLARKFYCKTDNGIKGQYLWETLSLADDDEIDRLKKKIQMAAEKKVSNDEIQFSGPAKDRATVLCDVSPVRNEAEEVVYIAVQGQDITHRKKSEKEKLNLETQLRQAQKMEALGTLAGGIAHDFNNILSVILGYADMGKTRAIEDSYEHKSLSKIAIAADKAKKLVRQILGFSRQNEFERIPCRPAQVMEEALKLMRVSIPASINLETEIDEKCGSILADPTQLHQILINLCTNANHAMEYKGGILKITLNEITITENNKLKISGLPTGRYARLTICDDGQGMDPDTMERIFDPYFTTKEVGKGTGMGLSIVLGIVKNHSGQINVKSQLGEGTVFDIYFPIIEKPAQSVTAVPQAAPTGNEKILLIDDEQEFLNMTKEMMEMMGYHVVAKDNSTEALDLFMKKPDQFDLAMTDYTMPGLNGIEVAQKFLKIRPEIPIILCTGYSRNLTKQKVNDMGIKELIFKPMDFNSLSHAINNLLSN